MSGLVFDTGYWDDERNGVPFWAIERQMIKGLTDSPEYRLWRHDLLSAGHTIVQLVWSRLVGEVGRTYTTAAYDREDSDEEMATLRNGDTLHSLTVYIPLAVVDQVTVSQAAEELVATVRESVFGEQLREQGHRLRVELHEETIDEYTIVRLTASDDGPCV